MEVLSAKKKREIRTLTLHSGHECRQKENLSPDVRIDNGSLGVGRCNFVAILVSGINMLNRNVNATIGSCYGVEKVIQI